MSTVAPQLEPVAQAKPQQPDMTRWKWYVSGFLFNWAVLAFYYGWWREILEHWRMALVMVLGSLVAGSTPMGGGTVAFPILVLVFGEAPANARNFGLIIQALGMTSALLFMVCRKVPLPFKLLAGSTAGAAAGFLIGNYVVGPHLQASFVKLLFACLWMSFGLLTLARNSEICGLAGRGPVDRSYALWIGVGAGVIGGIMAAMIGVGVEMCVYTAMVLFFRADLKISIPTAVAAAALASILGAALHLYVGDVDHTAVMNWLAAGPIVVFGAPIGTWIGSKLQRIKVLYFVSGLCVFQFCWTLWQTAHSSAEWLFVAIAMAVAITVLIALYRTGKRRQAIAR